ncbi:MAG: GNAT family N-acetyltransferase [Cyanobacteria bacterium P01_H01_bin.121]
MSVITTRQASADDSEVLAQLAECTFREAFATADNGSDMNLYCAEKFGPELQRQEILDPNGTLILAEIERQLVGYAHIRLHSPKACVAAQHPSELRRLYVLAAWHGRGVAQNIMAQVLATVLDVGADSLWLGVWEHNPKAIAFYRKYGFQVVGEHTFQFGNELQRDLVMMAAVKP